MRTARTSFHSVVITFLFCILASYDALSQVNPQTEQAQKASYPSGDTYKNSAITYILIPGINKTWGYDILVDKRIKIHQPSIPGVPGNEGFKIKKQAEKVAILVIDKMKNGEMPPTITIEEMKKINAL